MSEIYLWSTNIPLKLEQKSIKTDVGRQYMPTPMFMTKEDNLENMFKICYGKYSRTSKTFVIEID